MRERGVDSAADEAREQLVDALVVGAERVDFGASGTGASGLEAEF
jgi:hypothetical protein